VTSSWFLIPQIRKMSTMTLNWALGLLESFFFTDKSAGCEPFTGGGGRVKFIWQCSNR